MIAMQRRSLVTSQTNMDEFHGFRLEDCDFKVRERERKYIREREKDIFVGTTACFSKWPKYDEFSIHL